MTFDIKRAFVRLIETTGDPTAPIKLQEAAARVESVGRMMVSLTTKEQLAAIQLRLMSDFEDAELDELCKTPAFVMALCSMLNEALISFTIAVSETEA